MTGLDANVVVRFLVADDPAQHRAAAALFAGLTEDAPGFLGRETLVELVWVLKRAYGFDRAAIADALDGLLGSLEIAVESPADAAAASAALRGGADFADAMIVAAARRAGCAALVTFDRGAARLDGARLLETG